MAEKRKSTPQAKVLTVVLLILFLGSCAVLIFAVCTDILGINKDNPTEPVTTTNVSASEDVTTLNTEETSSSTALESSTAESGESELYFAEKYEIVSVCDEQGNEMDLRVAFGNNFKEGFVEFDGGRFFITLTVQGPPDNYGGTYSFVSDTEAELRYDNSNIKSAFIKETDGTGLVTVVDVTMSSDFVITCELV